MSNNVAPDTSAELAGNAGVYAKNSKAREEELVAVVDQYGASVDTLNSLRSSTTSIQGLVDELGGKNERLVHNKDGKLRDAHMDTYTAKRYKAHSRAIFIFTMFCVCAIVVLAIRNMGYIGADTANLGIGGIAIVGGIAMVYQIVDLTMRDNMDYDAYAWNYNPNNHSPTVYEYNKAQFGKLSGTDLSAFGISTSTCADASCCSDGTKFNSTLGKCEVAESFATIDESIRGKIHMGGKRSVDHVVLPSPPTNVTPLSTHTDCASCVNHS